MGFRTWFYQKTGIKLKRNLNKISAKLDGGIHVNEEVHNKIILDSTPKNKESNEQPSDKNNEENSEITEVTAATENNQLNLDSYVNFGAIVHESSVIGQYTYLNSNALVNSHVTIGKFCSIACDVIIAPDPHPLNWLSTHPFQCDPQWANSIGVTGEHFIASNNYTIIKNDVWIGAKAVIKRGITIGNGAIIGSCAMVTKDVPDYAIVAGNPAKIIRYRFSQDIIEKLNKLEWWNLPVEALREIKFNDIDTAIVQLSELNNSG